MTACYRYRQPDDIGDRQVSRWRAFALESPRSPDFGGKNRLLASALSSALFGVDAYLVEIEVDISHGVPKPTIVGLAEGAVRESLDRVRSAIKNSGYEFPHRKITVNLAPADTRKEGSAFDLPIALGAAGRQQGAQARPSPRISDARRAVARRPGQGHQGSACRPRFWRAIANSPA